MTTLIFGHLEFHSSRPKASNRNGRIFSPVGLGVGVGFERFLEIIEDGCTLTSEFLFPNVSPVNVEIIDISNFYSSVKNESYDFEGIIELNVLLIKLIPQAKEIKKR